MKHLETRKGQRLLRPNKTARGMIETLNRSARPRLLRGLGRPSPGRDVLALAVRGTTDETGARFAYMVEKSPCQSCGCKCNGRRKLNAKGRARLRTLRGARAVRANYPGEAPEAETEAAVAEIERAVKAWDDRLRARGGDVLMRLEGELHDLHTTNLNEGGE